MYCTNCGTKLEQQHQFCAACGTAVARQLQSDSSPDMQEHTLTAEQELELFVGNNYKFYQRKWGAAKEPGKRSGWNWPAFFIGMFWLGYRKMYLYIVYILLVFLGFDLLSYIFKFGPVLESSIGIGTAVALGLSGNAMYHVHATKKIAECKKETSDVAELKAKLTKAGGTSWLGVIYSVLLCFAYAMVSIWLESLFI